MYSVYRFLEELNINRKPAIEQISFEYSKLLLGGQIGKVFYDQYRPTVVAEASLLSQKNKEALITIGYECILGGRLKNETEEI